jgi:hypothetical protein
MKSLFEQNGGTYTEINGYLIPDLILPKKDNIFIDRYGRLHREYHKKHRNSVYRELLHSGGLNTYLVEIDVNSREIIEKLTRDMAEKQGVTEKLKASDQMGW